MIERMLFCIGLAVIGGAVVIAIELRGIADAIRGKR